MKSKSKKTQQKKLQLKTEPSHDAPEMVKDVKQSEYFPTQPNKSQEKAQINLKKPKVDQEEEEAKETMHWKVRDLLKERQDI